MKKSASIVAVFSIILATLSSFTLREKTFYFPNRWEIFGVSPNTMNGNPYPSTASQIYSARICDNFWGQVSSYVEAVNQNFTDVNAYINDYNNDHFPSSAVICSPDYQYICVATVQYFNNMPGDASLVDYNYGDYILY